MKYTYLIVVAFLLSGCVTGNYQSYSCGVGYQSEQQDKNEYYVAYTGSSGTKIEKVDDFALLRSAELALEKGYRYFVVTESMNNKGELAAPVKQSYLGNLDSSSMSRMVTGLSGPKPKSELTIKLFHNKPDDVSYNARKVEEEIIDEYKASNSI